jgi:hypothetical protein
LFAHCDEKFLAGCGLFGQAFQMRWSALPFGMPELGKLLVLGGLIIAAVGALIWSGVGKGWLGELPGDIHVSKGNFSFHFPIVTCIVVSVVLTILLRLFRK